MTHAKLVLWLLTALCEAYERKLTDQLYELYLVALKDVDARTIEAALPKLLRRDTGFMPRPGEVFAACGGDGDPAQFDPEGLAWKLVRTAIGKIGGYCSVVFADPAIALAIDDMGGWSYLCELTQRELDFKAKDFPKRYELARRMKSPKVRVLAGLQQRDAKTDKADIKMIGMVSGEILIGLYRPPEEQKRLTFTQTAKPVSAVTVAGFAKLLEHKLSVALPEREATEESPVVALRKRSAEMLAVEAELRNHAKLSCREAVMDLRND